jgi:hypothetical protein
MAINVQYGLLEKRPGFCDVSRFFGTLKLLTPGKKTGLPL